jgi:1,2-diacylglycerol 3-beta-glucosyltransferase
MIALVLSLLAIPVALVSAYLLTLSLLAVVFAGRCRETASTGQPWRFNVVVPAHNEASGIAATIRSLLQVDYPVELFNVVVIADNCSDDTASRAREAGANVLERSDPANRGKGFALKYAFEHLRAAGTFDALVVVDADSVVSSNLLKGFSEQLAKGAEAVQAHYGVRNPGDSWRTLLMAVALGHFHRARSIGREALGLSCGLRGNGMCFRGSIVEKVPYNAFSLAEDVEYGITLARAGCRVVYADEVAVLGEMVTGEQSSRSQRIRWESGRRALSRAQSVRLLFDGLRERNAVLFDVGLDLILPPMSWIFIATSVSLALATCAVWFLGTGLFALWVSAFSALSLFIVVLIGWALSGSGLKGLLALGLAPAFVIWKMGLSWRQGNVDSWVRTDRENQHAP